MSTKELIQETNEAQVLALTLQNVPEYKIAEQLKLSRHAVRKIQKSDSFKGQLDDLNKKAVETALGEVQRGLEKMAPLALKALEKNLIEGDMVAVKAYFAAIGIGEKSVADAKGDTSIQIILPGQEVPKTFNAETGEEHGN